MSARLEANDDAKTQGTRPRLCTGAEAATAYRTVQKRIDKLVRGRADVCDQTVPACPQWSIHQTVSHLAGTAQDIASSNLVGAGTDAWTRAQLTRLADHSLDELLNLWAETTNTVTDLITHSPKLFGGQAVFDALTHEHDICGAMAEPGPRVMDPAFEVAAGFLTTMLDRSIRRKSTPALRLTTPDHRDAAARRPRRGIRSSRR